jgi:hypothetical protein
MRECVPNSMIEMGYIQFDDLTGEDETGKGLYKEG